MEKTFVLVHGAGDVGWYWHLVEQRLRRRGHDVVAPDLPCDDDNAGLDDYVRTVEEAIGDRDNLVVIGQSFGGYTATLLAARRPVRALVLVAGMIPVRGERPEDWFANTGWEEAMAEHADATVVPLPAPARSTPSSTMSHGLWPRRAMSRERHQSPTPGRTPWPLEVWPDVPTRFASAPRTGSSPRPSCDVWWPTGSASLPTRSPRATVWRPAARTSSRSCSMATSSPA